ncbi:hypothetical protein OIV83_005706 [Microbotryomycetes sp. JL201]|nr:hypothetical protein OIV83_005706 [Microbotryomycetes sp. JL201]
MDLIVAGGSPLKSFTRALACLTKFGEDIDLSVGRSELKLSSVNASRSAFGLVAFRSDFFARYDVHRRASGSRNLTLSVNGKCSFILNRRGMPHRHSSTLPTRTDHFHLKTSAGGGGTDEISFYHSDTACVLKSFGAELNKAADYLGARPLGTELAVDVGDFERYDVEGQPLITINLKELKAIIVLAEATDTSLDAAFTRGGSPFLIEVNADDFKADFVIATTDFDGGGPESLVKQERADVQSAATMRQQNGRPQTAPPSQHRQTQLHVPARPAAAAAAAAPATSASSRPALFNAPSQQPHQGESDEDEFGGDADFDDEAFAEIDRVSQAYSQQIEAAAATSQNATQPGARNMMGFEPRGEPLREDDEPATEDDDDDEGELILGQSPRQYAAVASPPPRKRVSRRGTLMRLFFELRLTAIRQQGKALVGF